jgi:hypothetical protein
MLHAYICSKRPYMYSKKLHRKGTYGEFVFLYVVKGPMCIVKSYIEKGPMVGPKCYIVNKKRPNAT